MLRRFLHGRQRCKTYRNSCNWLFVGRTAITLYEKSTAIMARCAFYSFHFSVDSHRAAQVRNMGVIEGNPPATDNDWQTITRGGDAAIKKWIDGQLDGKSCSIVLIGASTAGRRWINYEIEQSWNNKKGVLGIYIHKLKDLNENQSVMGANPFDGFTLCDGKRQLSSVVKTYNPPWSDSKAVYAYIKGNLVAWIDTAISTRENFAC